MESCLFCKILNGDIPSQKVFENENVFAFKDIHPMAKEHYLFIHRNHTKNVNEMCDQEPKQVADIFCAISEFTKQAEMIQNGFRVVTNTGAFAGQTVFHTHFHVLGGGPLGSFGAN